MSEVQMSISRSGQFHRKSDSKRVQRYRCRRCLKNFSNATFREEYWQKKRHLNFQLFRDLVSGVSQRRAAKNFHLSRRTVERKFEFVGRQCLRRFLEENQKLPMASLVVFDDMETFEHTKCKPLSIALAVENPSRRILGFEVSQMAAKGKLSKIALKKYGPRRDLRSQGRLRLFQSLKNLVESNATFKSDQNPFYPKALRLAFPKATHKAFKGQRGSIVGQGELKKIRWDPLFSLNHTCAMFRANINRLFRKTWCTTKKPEKLLLHLAMYAYFHNKWLIDH
jgi:transposase-like protein